MQNQSCCSGESLNKQNTKSCCAETNTVKNQSCCCGTVTDSGHEQSSCGCECSQAGTKKWIVGYAHTPAGDVPEVSTQLSFSDKWGSWKCRWSIGRMHYTIDPGLYCVGNPDAQSPVLVTANYKMTFDRLRMELSGLDAWIVVLNTYGINVWCAAGKGTFGTEELVNRLQEVRLSDVVSHRTVILPQLGAAGVAAHRVLKQSGFRVVYGPIRACDIKEFLSAGRQQKTCVR